MKIRAAVLEEFGKPLVVQDVELAGPKAGEVLVRVEACGVCHTDLYTASGADPTGYAPCVLGHEGLRHFMGTSTFAEATVMPEIALAKVGPDVPPEGASIFACGLSTGLGAAFYTAQVEPGTTCAVFGCGLVGLGAVAGCRLRGAEQIVAIDLSEE